MARASASGAARRLVLPVGGAQLGQGEEGEGALVGRGAGLGQRQRGVQVRPRVGVPAGGGVEFAEQAVGGEQGERLARLAGVRQGRARRARARAARSPAARW